MFKTYKTHKYSIPIDDEFSLTLPYGAKTLSFQVQQNELQMWALVDPEDPRTERRRFRLAGTGHLIEPDGCRLNFIGTCQLKEGRLVLHLFELVPQ